MRARSAADLRAAFDRAFSEPPRAQRGPSIDLLAVRLRGAPFALPLSGVSGLFADRPLTRLPTAAPDFLGLASSRGIVVPVYDLGALLGYPVEGAPRWLIVAASTAVGLAFDAFDGALRLPQDAITPQGPRERTHMHVRDLVRPSAADAPLRPLIDLDSVITAVRERARQDAVSSPRE